MSSDIESYILAMGLAYLLGLGVAGYTVSLMFIEKKGKKYNLPNWLIKIFVVIHFFLGMTGILYFPSKYFYYSKNESNIIESIIFFVVAFLGLSIALLVIREKE